MSEDVEAWQVVSALSDDLPAKGDCNCITVFANSLSISPNKVSIRDLSSTDDPVACVERSLLSMTVAS